jgi:molecular chaperone Hsp33
MQHQDKLQTFIFQDMDIRGQITTLAASQSEILAQHDYPPSVALVFSEFLAAVSLLGATLKYSGRVILQAKGRGPVTTIMAECSSDGGLRGIVHGDLEYCDDLLSLASLIGSATLAITIEPDKGERYQGIVPLEGEHLSQCLEHYFEQSEQLPTKIKLASSADGVSGILVQQMPDTQDREKVAIDWLNVSALLATLRPDEQLSRSHNEQLYLLFHEHLLRLFEPVSLHFRCTCSRLRTERALRALGHQEVAAMCLEIGAVEMTCQFCNTQYRFDEAHVDALFENQNPSLH